MNLNTRKGEYYEVETKDGYALIKCVSSTKDSRKYNLCDEYGTTCVVEVTPPPGLDDQLDFMVADKRRLKTLLKTALKNPETPRLMHGDECTCSLRVFTNAIGRVSYHSAVMERY